MIAVCSGCASSTQLDDRQDSAGKVRAVCTVGMVAELVRNVGGENVVVDQLMDQVSIRISTRQLAMM